MSNYWEEVQLDALREEIKQSTDTERIRALIIEHPALVASAATNPNTPPELLIEWSQHSPETTRLSLIQNTSLPTECFSFLVNNAPQTRMRAIASCPRTPSEILRDIARGTYTNAKILVAIAENPSTPPEVLERLSNHQNIEVYQAAQKNPHNPLYVAGAPQQRWSRERRPREPGDFVGAPELIIEQMTRSEVPLDRMSVANFGALNKEQRQRLARDPDPQVREWLARRQDLSEESIEHLTEEKNPAVLSRLISNNNIPEARRRELLTTLLSGDESSRALAAQTSLLTDEEKASLSQDSSAAVRLMIASNWTLSLEWIDKLADDPDANVRQRAALHTKATPEIRERVMRSINSQTLSSVADAPPISTPTRATPPAAIPATREPRPLNINRLGIGVFLLSFAFLLMFSSTEEPLYLSAMMIALFLAVMIISMDKDEQAAKKRGVIGIAFLVASVFLLPLAVAFQAPLWFVLLVAYLLFTGAFLLVTSSTSSNT